MLALQEAQRETVAAFESFMSSCLVADWARDKRALFDAAMPDSSLPATAGQLAPGGFEPSYAPMPICAPSAMPGAHASQGRLKTGTTALQLCTQPMLHAGRHACCGICACQSTPQPGGLSCLLDLGSSRPS